MDKMHNVLQTLMQHPLHPVHNWQTFLNFGTGADWSKLNCVATADDLHLLQGCMCGLDPWQQCPKHPCMCPVCRRKGKNSSSGAKRAKTCCWRQSGHDFMKTLGLDVTNQGVSHLSYVQTADVQGISTPQTARARHLLNVCACCPNVAPVHDSFVLVDISQSLCWKPWSGSGAIPTIATNTVLRSMNHARVLSLGQLAELMGHKLINESFEDIPYTAQRKLLGNSIHVASVGALLMAGIAMACP